MADAGLKIRVEYCAECGYLQRATWMIAEILGDIADSVASLELVPGHLGTFEWSVDGTTVFSKNESGRFPDLDDLKATIYALVD